jgi:ELWxxDGT repeat protein
MVVLAACSGGSDDEPAVDAAAPGTATVGPAGGRVALGDGAEVVFPPKALGVDVRVVMTKDSTGAPPLPPSTQAAGAVYTITPHGGRFNVHAEVSIPVERATIADNEQLVLVTAQPGDTQWTVLSGATYSNGKLRAPVMHFSFFQAIVLIDTNLPTLVTTISDGNPFETTSFPRTNNVGGPGIQAMSPDLEFGGPPSEFAGRHLEARLTYAPPATLTRRTGVLLNPPRICRPVSLGHDGAQWRVLVQGAPVSLAGVRRLPLDQRPTLSLYPGQPQSRFLPDPTLRETVGTALMHGGPVSGFGAVHFYGNSAVPPRGPYMPAGSADVWASPPVDNVLYDDTYVWLGHFPFGPQHNGRVAIEASVPTDCGLSIQAVPIAFRLNFFAVDDSGLQVSGFRGVQPIGLEWMDLGLGFRGYAYQGQTVSMPFEEVVADSSQSIRWEFTTDPAVWRGEVPASRIQRGADETGRIGWSSFNPLPRRRYSIVIPNVQPSDAGYYRGFACAKPNGALCLAGFSTQLTVITEPPRITRQPTPVTLLVSERASFGAWASYWESVQWQRRHVVEAAFNLAGWADIPGATEEAYVIPAVTAADNGYLYRAVFTSPTGRTATEAAALVVTLPEQPSPPIITGQPANQQVVTGSTATFVATVTGSAPFNYQWRKNGGNLPGANSATLTLSNVSAQDEANYDLVVTNRAASVISGAARLTVTLAPGTPQPPQILASPASISVAAGNAANFAVAVSGAGPFTYQWLKNGTAITGGTSAAFAISPVALADAGSYTVRVTNAAGSVTSAAATLTVTASTPAVLPPTIAMAPISLAVPPGAGATLAVAVTGTAPFAYQWLRNGEPVAGATSAMLHFPAASALDAGQYTVVITNAAGAATSSAAQLIVTGAPLITAQPLNVSAVTGATATFSVSANGDGLRYQWLRDGVAIAGATGASYTTPALTLADTGAVFNVIVYNSAGVTLSARAVLTVLAASAFPANAVALRATHADFGQELWLTDGTSDGTVLVKDINPGPNGSSISGFTRFGNHVYFSANDGSSGAELWRTDGTEAGTVRVADINPDLGSASPWGLIACNGRLFFGANNGSSAGAYSTDGTAAGTVRLANVIVGIYDPVACLNNVVYFNGGTAAQGGELWRSDGTAAGTYLVADIAPGTSSSNPEEFTEFQGQLYFQAANQLWRTDGTTAGTVRVSETAFTPRRFVVNGSTLYFTAQTGEAGFEPWKSDGTVAGTLMIADLVSGPASSFPTKFTVSNGVTFFSANPASGTPSTLWRTDGTAAGTINLTPGLRFAASYGDSILDVGGTLFFSAADVGQNVELYKSDGTAGGTVRVTELLAGTNGSYPQAFFRIGSRLYFAAQSQNDTELWSSDGTAVGTVQVKDMCITAGCGGNPSPR